MINKLKICACDPVVPIVYDDSLSYYEAINKTVNKVNECVEVVNQLTGVVANFSTTIDDIQNRLGTAESTITEHSLKLISLQSGVDELVESVNDLKNTVNTHATDIANLKTNYSELAGRMTNVEADVSTLSNTVATQGTKLTTVESDVNALKGRQHVEIYTDDDSGNYYADVTEPNGDTNQYNIAGTDNLNRVKSDLISLSNTVSTQGTKITNVENSVSTLSNTVATQGNKISEIDTDVGSLFNSVAKQNTRINSLTGDINALNEFTDNFAMYEVPESQIIKGLPYSGITSAKAHYTRIGSIYIVNAIVQGVSNLIANEMIISIPFNYSPSPNVKVANCIITNTTSTNGEPYDVDNIVYASVVNNILYFRAKKASSSVNSVYTFSCILY